VVVDLFDAFGDVGRAGRFRADAVSALRSSDFST